MKNILFLIPFFFVACLKENFKKEEFSLLRENYNGNQLLIDGYYFNKINDVNTSEQYFNIYVFYKNGVLLKPNSTLNVIELIDKFIRKDYNQEIEEFWGIYQIINSTIKIEYFGVRHGAWGKLPVYIKTGTIINDTTFIITEEMRSKDGSEYKALNETFHFVRYQKPDSTNNFIK